MAVETAPIAAARFLTSLHHPSHILVAVSGGSDSIGLLVALAAGVEAGHHAHRLSVATIDHDLRPESADEARTVADFCAKLGIAHRIRRWTGEKPKTGLMAAAREARYALLADIAAEVSADLIVTGHTFDDQQETLAMRGARLPTAREDIPTGIADAVLFCRRIWVARPLLACLRADIRAYLGAQDIGWIDDPSNIDMHYERVQVRIALSERGPSDEWLADGGEARAALSALAAHWLGEYVQVHGGLLCRIARAGLDVSVPAVVYGLSQLAATFGGEPFGPGRQQMQRICDFIDSGAPGRRTAGGVVFDLRRDGLYLVRESRNIEALLLAPAERQVWDGRFDVANGSAHTVQIVAGGADGATHLPVGTPKGVAMRAAAVAPTLQYGADADGKNEAAVTITPHLAPFDRFLTRFDLIFADRLALCFERTSYLEPPF